MKQRIRTLVIDDSPTMREALRLVFASTEDIDVSSVADPFAAVAAMRLQAPDVILLDLELPKMDGLTFLKRLMAQHPLPVVICSSTATPGSQTVIHALEAGAVEAILKPHSAETKDLEAWEGQVIDAVRRAAAVPRQRLSIGGVREKLLPDVIIPPQRATRFGMPTDTVIVVGASTGGTRALADFLSPLPSGTPGIVVVQHMPELFTGQFAKHLDTLCQMEVREAQDGDRIETGVVLIAPGGKHTLVHRKAGHLEVEVRDGPPVNRHRPSVDVLFRSAAINAAPRAVGVILTGMGDDGARCMRELHDAGATTFAQDEATCVVFGMPKEAIAMGGVDHVLPLDSLPKAVAAAAHLQHRKTP